MGTQSVDSQLNSTQIRLFEKRLLDDVATLEKMLAGDIFETGVSRIGAEQEMFLVDEDGSPSLNALEILEDLGDEHFTTELGKFNLEFNLDPLSFEGKCFSSLRDDLDEKLNLVRKAGKKYKTEPVITGILPTLRKADLTLKNMTPKPRYFALNEAISRMRGNNYDMYLRGIDQLYIKHDSVMLEACNTSFQVHFQVSPADFVQYHNIAQAIAGPVMAAAVNSPLIFGKRLWGETRIAVFQHSTDTRGWPSHLRQSVARVTFGQDWLDESVLEIFKEDIARYRVLLAAEIEESSSAMLASGQIPKLRALQMHNSSIYRWTRPCYGVTNGKPHLRIENRLFAAGPSVADEVANASFWFGLLKGIANQYGDVRKYLKFDDAKLNFFAAARIGLQAQFTWLDNEVSPAKSLILEKLLPLAQAGLEDAAIASDDIEHNLGIIRNRVESGLTGSEWMLQSFNELKKENSTEKCLISITKDMAKHQKNDIPAHEWPLAKTVSRKDLPLHYLHVRQFMTSDLFTVQSEDTVNLVLNIMKWRKIRHLPVESFDGKLVGMVDYRVLVKLLSDHRDNKDYELMPVNEIMDKQIPTVTPETTTLDAIQKMKKYGVSCLPVLSEKCLVGIVTENDFMALTAQFIESAIHRVEKETTAKATKTKGADLD